MRLLYLLQAGIENFHGASKHVLGLSGAIADKGVPVRLLCGSDGLRIHVPGREVVAISSRERSGLSLAAAMLARAPRDPWARLDDTVVFVRGNHLSFAATVTAAIHRRPLVVELNGLPEFTWVVERDAAGRVSPASLIGRLKGYGTLLAARSSYGWLLSAGAAFFVNNSEARDHLVLRRGIRPSLVHVVPLGYDPVVAQPRPLEECRRALGLSPRERLIVHVGSLYRYKGADTLLEAFFRLKPADSSLVFVGDGEFRAELSRRARQAGMHECVRFVGECPFDETPLWAGAADVTVGLSQIDPRWGCCPTKVIEYAACGVPIVANSMAITRELAKVMPMCLVDDARSVDQVADALRQLLDADPRRQRRETLPPEVRAYAWPEIGGRAVEIMSSLLPGSTRPADT